MLFQTHIFGKGPNKFESILSAFTASAAFVFFVTGVAKVISSFGMAGILDLADPVSGVSFRHLLLLAGSAELIISALCVTLNNRKVAIGLVGWFSINLLIYRIGLFGMGYRGPCPCMGLGNLTDAIHVSNGAADMVMKMILLYLLIGSLVSLILLYARHSIQQPGWTLLK